jgi:4-amino-4-deoxy-L-arabinose transferase-like glycosyltransferase
MLGPDEPRYADVGRAMAASGDWITPRLWGLPWFEKPALLYWLTAIGFQAGLSEDLAPRLPVALLSIGFVLFFAGCMRREFGDRAAAFSAAILATSVLWLGYSHVGVFDLPLAATFGACMLLVMGKQRTFLQMAMAGTLLGAAMLCKGFVPCVLFLPALWFLRRDWKHIALIAAGATVVAAPWYALVIARNGAAFIDDFFWKQQFSRFTSPELQHVRPFWFYVPVLLGGFFPWTPIGLIFVRQRSLFRDQRVQFLLAWVLWGLIFFSISVNKLPGYVLPLFPALAALAGVGLARHSAPSRWLLAFCGASVWLLPVAGQMLPDVLLHGSAGLNSNISPLWVLPALVSGTLVWWLETSNRRGLAVAMIVSSVTLCVIEIVSQIYPILDRTVSARQYWSVHSPSIACSEEANRGWHYSLNYYAQKDLPACQSPLRR